MTHPPPTSTPGKNYGEKLWYELFMGAMSFDEPLRSKQLDAHAKKLSVSQKKEAFNTACTSGLTSIISALLENGINVNHTFSSNNTGLHIAASNGKNHAVLFLLEQGANIDARNNKGKTPLHLAAGVGKTDTAYLLCEMGANTKIKDAGGRTAWEIGVRTSKVLNLQLMQKFTEAGKKKRRAVHDFKNPAFRFKLKPSGEK